MAVFTADSAFPFALGLPGLLVRCSKSHVPANFWKVSDVNWGPLFNNLVRTSVSCEVTLQLEDHFTGQGVVSLVNFPVVADVVDCNEEIFVVRGEEINSDFLPWPPGRLHRHEGFLGLTSFKFSTGFAHCDHFSDFSIHFRPKYTLSCTA